MVSEGPKWFEPSGLVKEGEGVQGQPPPSLFPAALHLGRAELPTGRCMGQCPTVVD